MNCHKFALGLFILFFLAIPSWAAPVIDPIANVTIPAGKSLILPLTATSPSGQPLTYTVYSSNTNHVATILHTNNPFWQLTVAQVANPGDPGAYETPFRGGTATVTNVGSMTFMLFPEYAPHTVNIFQGLTTSGFYNSNTIFHRVVSNFVIQGGDPQTNGDGGLVFQYNDEFNPQAIFSGNGQLALANNGKDTDGSQFFVTIGQQRSLDFGYTLFGQLVRGFDVLTNINNTPVDTNTYAPLTEEIIKQASYVNDATDAVLTLTATNLPGDSETITVVASDGIGGFATNTFTASLVADTNNDNGQPFFYPNTVTNLVVPVNTTVSNTISAIELGNDELYWFPYFLTEADYDSATNSNYSITNNWLQTLTYNVTNIDGLFKLYIVPNSNYVGTVSMQFNVSSSSEWSLYEQYGLTLPAYDQQVYTFVIGDTPIAGQSNYVSELTGTAFNNAVLATFTNGVPSSAATNFTAFINWGDNSTNVANVTAGSNGVKAILGSHTYAYAGVYPVYIKVQSAIGASATILSYINVTNQLASSTSVLTVQTTGEGSVSPDYNNTVLNVGGNYTMSAVPADSWVLASWTDENGYILGTSPDLTFTMTPGLSITANFALAVPPTIAVTSVVSGQVLTNLYSQPATISGTASDNATVTAVWYQINGGSWLESSGTTNWTFSFSPAYGVANSIRVYAVNNDGFVSSTNVLSVKYLAGDVLTVSTNGLGSVNPVLNDQLLPLGSNYVLTATASNGFTFTGWTGSLTTNKAALTFTMTSNLDLIANFADKTIPKLTVTNLVTGRIVTSNTFTVGGTASDNWAVSGVYYQFNNSGWTLASGTANWSVGLSFVPGTNVFQVYAVDPSGTPSVTNTIRVVYVVSAQLTVNTTGRGTISPNYSNAVLTVGQNYTVKATPATGFGFVNWTAGIDGTVLTNNTSLTFTMESNLVVTANFVDVTKPTITVTNPVASTVIASNASYTLAGKSSDNLAVTAVYYSLNSSGYLPVASLFNNGSNWTTQVTLTPGTNTVSVYAQDAAGNDSITNTVRLIYVVSAQLTVNTTGRGSISPDYSNAVLAVKQNYTVKATPTAGFAFVNWTAGVDGTVLTNNATLTFAMASNLVLTANFVDVTKPTIAVTNPVASTVIVSNASYTLAGKAGDNVAVTAVNYSLNGSGFAPVANLFNNGSNWTTQVTLTPGTNTVSVYAQDAALNYSITNTVRLVYVVSAQLTVNTTGRGTISPNYSNAVLAVKQNYTVKATPTAGFAFVNWTAGIDGTVLTNNATLTFAMASNLVLTANFVDVTKPTLSITNPVASTVVVSNASYTLAGKASDNVGVTAVNYSLNGSGFVPVSNLFNNGSNWTTQVTLTPGTNTVSVYAQDAALNYSITNTVRLVYMVAPASLSGLVGYVTPQGSTTASLVAFGTSTFSQFSTDTNNNNGVGSYTYVRATPTTGTLTITFVSPPSAAKNGKNVITLTFMDALDATFTNSNDSGVIQLQAGSNLTVASLANQTLYVVEDSGRGNAIHFTGSTAAVVGLGTSETNTGTYTYSTYSDVGALLKVSSNTNGTTYIVTAAAGTNYGNFYLESYDSAGNLNGTDFGVFGLASQKTGGNAPSSIANFNGEVYSAADLASVAFGSTIFSQFDINDTNNFGANGIGVYAYTQLGTNNGELSLTAASPPTAALNGTETEDIWFIAPNLGIFTNSTGIVGAESLSFGAIALTTATNWTSTGVAGKTLTATNELGDVITIQLNGDGSFNYSSTGNVSDSGNYSYTVGSSIGALVQLNFTSGEDAGQVVYLQLNFNASGTGAFFVTSSSGYDWGAFSLQ